MDDHSRPGMIIAAVLVMLAVMYLTWLYFQRATPTGRTAAPTPSAGAPPGATSRR